MRAWYFLMVIEVVNVNVRMTYSIVIVGRLSQSVGDGDASGLQDASMPGGTSVILPLLAELTQAASVIPVSCS